ncbi:unnamed protein product, partial [Strongylus vulgaris]
PVVTTQKAVGTSTVVPVVTTQKAVGTSTVVPVVTTKAVVTPSSTPRQAVTTAAPLSTKSPVATTSAPAPISLDIVILIDVSQSATNTYDDMSMFVLTLMQNFAVSQSYARTAIIPVFGTPDLGTMAVATLDSITSYNMLTSYLSQTKDNFNDFTDQGQALSLALSTATNPTFKQAGYRSNISNHLILYVTSTSGFSTGAQTTAQQKIAGGNACSFYAPDKATLNQLSASVQALITAAR